MSDTPIDQKALEAATSACHAVLRRRGLNSLPLATELAAETLAALSASGELDVAATRESWSRLFQANLRLHKALERLMNDPHGCAFCDYGILRGPKPHDEKCPWLEAERLMEVEDAPTTALPASGELELVCWVTADILAAMKRGERVVPGWKPSADFNIPLYATPPAPEGKAEPVALGSEDDPESLAHALRIGAMGTPFNDYQGTLYMNPRYKSDEYRDAEFRDYGLARAVRVILNNAEAILLALSTPPGAPHE